MKKFTIQDVQNYLLEHDINHECELISKEYINAKTDLEFRCCKCGRAFKRNFTNLKRNEHYFCPPCSQGTNLSIEDVKEFLKKNDLKQECELLSTQYQNWHTPLKFKCNKCGKTFERRFSQVKQKIFLCYDCCKKSQNKEKRLSIENVKSFLKENDLNQDCELISNIYVNTQTPLLFKCNTCGGTFERTFATMKAKKAFKCFRCAHHIDPDYDATIYQSLLSYFRGKTYLWKKNFLASHKQCDITGVAEGELDIHHLINFQTILNQASNNTNIPLIYKPNEFEKYGYDFNILVTEFLNLHKEVPAVLLKKELHQNFHKIYGYKNNTPDQYYEFKKIFLKKGDVLN